MRSSFFKLNSILIYLLVFFGTVTFSDYVNLQGNTGDIRMWCNYDYTLEFDLGSAGTNVSNFVELITELQT